MTQDMIFSLVVLSIVKRGELTSLTMTVGVSICPLSSMSFFST